MRKELNIDMDALSRNIEPVIDNLGRKIGVDFGYKKKVGLLICQMIRGIVQKMFLS